MRKPFQFKQFTVEDSNSPMKVNTDAVLLGAWVQHPNPLEILDVGTGCGIIAMMLAQRFKGKITAIDINEGAIQDAYLNFSRSGWSERFEAILHDFNSFQINKQFDLILSNPPYFSNSLKSPLKDRNISRHTDTLSHTDLISNSRRLLKTGGILGVIIPWDVFQYFEMEAKQCGLHLKRVCNVIPVDGKKPNRVLAEFTDKPLNPVPFEEIIIHHPGHIPTEAYKKLTADFYPAF